MIRSLAEKTARYITDNDADADFEVMAYGYELLYQEIGITLLALLLAIPAGLLLPVAASILSYNLLRKYAGGSHAKHRVVCTAASILILYGPAVAFVKAGAVLTPPVILGLYAADFILLALYAPADTAANPLQYPEKRRTMKRVSLAILTGYFALAVVLYSRLPAYAFILVGEATIISVCTHPIIYWILGCEKSNTVEEKA